jgi:hypothetical protein
MNAQSIWAGEHYAYSPFRPNKLFITDARRCVAKKVIKKREWGNERLTTYVLVDRVDNQDGEVLQADLEIRARDIIDFWDSYANERDALLKEREERYRKQQEDLERRRREREEELRQEKEDREARSRAETEHKEALVNALIKHTGMPRNAVYSVGPGAIQLDRAIIELWLSSKSEG